MPERVEGNVKDAPGENPDDEKKDKPAESSNSRSHAPRWCETREHQDGEEEQAEVGS